MTERDGCEVLKRCFTAAGFTIAERHPLALDAGVVELDGYDAARRVGYEYLTSEEGDHEAVTPAMREELERRMAAGELHVLMIDEAEGWDAASLATAAERFLARVTA
jgi:hypothetical protein